MINYNKIEILKTITNKNNSNIHFKKSMNTFYSVKDKIKFLTKLQKLKDDIKKKKQIKKNLRIYKNCKKFVSILKKNVEDKKLRNFNKMKIITYNKILNLYYKKNKYIINEDDLNKVSIIDFLKHSCKNMKISDLFTNSLRNLNMYDLKNIIKKTSSNNNINNKSIDSPILKKKKEESNIKRRKLKKLMLKKLENNKFKKKFLIKDKNKIYLKNIYEARLQFQNQLKEIKNKSEKNYYSLQRFKTTKNNLLSIKRNKKNKRKRNSYSDSESNLIPFEYKLSSNYDKVLKIKSLKSNNSKKNFDDYLKKLKLNIDKCNKNFLYNNE